MTETQELAEGTPTPFSLESDLGWNTAHELLAPFGAVASNFSEAVRTLMTCHEKGDSRISATGSNHVERLLRTDAIKITYYHFSKQFKPSLFAERKHLDVADFLDAYTPLEHAAIISFCYLFKTLSRKIEKDEWEFVQTPLYEALCTGGGAGLCIPEIGLGLGLIGRGLRYLAYAPFLHENRKEFKNYRRHLKSIDKPFDSAFEQDVWQCTSIQIAGLLLERIGFSQGIALQYMAAAERSASVKPNESYGVPFRLAECLVEAYMEGQDIPTTTPSWVGIKLDLNTETRANLLATLNKVFADKARIEWLSKIPTDISPELTPELFVTETPAQDSAQTSSDDKVDDQGLKASEPHQESLVPSETESSQSDSSESASLSENDTPEKVVDSPESESDADLQAPSEEIADALGGLDELDATADEPSESEK
jgi:hypothetical protein